MRIDFNIHFLVIRSFIFISILPRFHFHSEKTSSIFILVFSHDNTSDNWCPSSYQTVSYPFPFTDGKINGNESIFDITNRVDTGN